MKSFKFLLLLSIGMFFSFQQANAQATKATPATTATKMTAATKATIATKATAAAPKEVKGGITQVSVIRAKLMVANDGALMIDVREPNELAALAYDVDGIVNIPLSQLADRMKEVPMDTDVIIACRSGNRSQKASLLLAENGFTNIINMKGGIKDWQAKNLPVIVDGKTTKKACCSKSEQKKCCSSKGDSKKCDTTKSNGKKCGSAKSNGKKCGGAKTMEKSNDQ